MNHQNEEENSKQSPQDPQETNLPEDNNAKSSLNQGNDEQSPGNILTSLPEDLDTPIGELNIPVEEEPEIPEFDFSSLETSARANIEELGFTPLPEIERPSYRRRRARQPLIARLSEEEVPDRLENMAQRAVPTFDFFIFAILAGSLMGIGYITNSPAILLLAIALAPFPAPWIGISLAAATGESRFFSQTLGGFFTAILIIFVTGLLAGLTSRIFMPLILDQAYLHTRLWWADLLLVIIGATAIILLFSQKEENPVLPGLLLNYGLLLPISAAGFGLGNGTAGLWPQGMAIFLVHLALSIVLGLSIFYYMGFRPIESIGYAWGAGVIIVSLIVVIGFAGLGTILPAPPAAPLPEPTATPNLPSTPTTISPTHTKVAENTPTPQPPTRTPEPTQTSVPSATPVIIPTTTYGRIQSRPDGDGAAIRDAPSGQAITTVLNGYVVEILPDAPVTVNNSTWIKIKVTTSTRVLEGWVLQSLIVTPTPQP